MAMAECLNADIYTTDISLPKEMMGSHRFFSIGDAPNIPFFRQMSSAYRFMASDITDQYDMYVFSGNWAHHASKHHQPSLFYCHTPVRALYDLYPIFKNRLSLPARPGYAAWATAMRGLDQRSIRRIDHIVANSQNTQKRIQRYYLREAEVVYPPVDTREYSLIEYGDFWLSVNRLYPEKRIDLQIDAFSRMPDQNLVIVGGFSIGDHAAPYAQLIRERVDQADNITLLGQIPDEQLNDLYSRCRGLICTAMDEDFGITPLEAMASGKPVIAVAEGGFLETVTPECGRFISPSSDNIIAAVRDISEDPEQFRSVCLSRASLFDIPVFEKAIRRSVQKVYEEWSDSV